MLDANTSRGRRRLSQGPLQKGWPKRSVAGASLSAARQGDARAAIDLDIWTYRHLTCIVGSLVTRDSSARACDADAILSIALRRVEASRDTVVDPGSYASWVSVVGRNAYLNYRRARPTVRMVQEADLSYDAETHMETVIDGALVETSVRDAIERLPAFLRVVATMRLVEDRSYDSIAAATGKSKATLRAYVNKALDRLRTDQLLTRLLAERK